MTQFQLDLDKLHDNFLEKTGRGSGKTIDNLVDVLGMFDVLDAERAFVVVEGTHCFDWVIPIFMELACGMGFDTDLVRRIRNDEVLVNGKSVRFITKEWKTYNPHYFKGIKNYVLVYDDSCYT